jgi:predicted small secreted protein
MNGAKCWSLCVLLAFLLTAGCHTTEGLGEDIERGGRKLKEEAREHM